MFLAGDWLNLLCCKLQQIDFVFLPKILFICNVLNSIEKIVSVIVNDKYIHF